MWQGRDTEAKTQGIKNIWFSTAIETGDCVEVPIQVIQVSLWLIALEAIQNDLFDVHFS